MTNTKSKIIYTQTDEAPALATVSLLPIVNAFTGKAGVTVETRDISLAGRIIASFPEALTENQRQADALAELGELAKTPAANIIKLPNISASIPQLTAAIAELQNSGYNLPDFPENPQSSTEEEIKSRYAKILGSAVNPVLREGNSDRRVAQAVKDFARKNPHSMGAWSASSKSHVAHMTEGDFFSSEQSVVLEKADTVRIEFVNENGEVSSLKSSFPLQDGEVIDSSLMSKKAICEFFASEIKDAKEQDILLSLHLKATMMKVSDPIIFGYAVVEYYKDVFEKHAKTFADIGVDPANGLGDVYGKIVALPEALKNEIIADIDAVYVTRPDLAMVNSDKGITNLHVPSDVIIDASMPAAIRTSGQMWGPDGKLKDMKAMIPDRCYAGIYQETINFCKENGAFDVATMGNVCNVGLMAQKAEEYGSHDKTFRMSAAGKVCVVNSAGDTIMEHNVQVGDIWRMCQTKDTPIKDWVRLAVSRAKTTGSPAIFWLDADRAHDANLIKKVNTYLKDHDTNGLDLQIMPPVEAIRYSMQRAKAGRDTISVTGNVLRDYLTDLFPIIELGTSAKMLSIIPLLAGGGLYETGAGGSAPKHVQQFVEEGHLRWDSLGEYLALAVSLEDLALKTGNNKALVLATALNQAIGLVLDNQKSPSRKVNKLDNRGGHFYLSLYWAQALAAQVKDLELKTCFTELAKQLGENENAIGSELIAAQGNPVDIGGYFFPDQQKLLKAMRPSSTWNRIMESI
jgi:isocitrate dehydrogenase